MNFDDVIDRRGTECAKWDAMEKLYGVSPDDGIAMWVADMDIRTPDCVLEAGRRVLDHGVLGYQGVFDGYLNSICWWMQTRHGWAVKPEEIFSTFGLVNAISIALHAFTDPGDKVILFTPVYHAFARVIRDAGREVVECELALRDGVYEMDFGAYADQLGGDEKMVISCSPHNPGGKVWSQSELGALADFCVAQDLLLISDEIHHDLVLPGQTHTVMANAAPQIRDRLIMMTAPSKTFNIAGNHAGNVIIQDKALHARFAATKRAHAVSDSVMGLAMTQAAYSPEGADWVDALNQYLAENISVFCSAMNAIPGLKAMPMQSTYLAWVDFSGTGMERQEFTDRVLKDARIAPNLGPSFGKGGDMYLRFNLGCPRSVVDEAIKRLTDAFSDLQ